MKKIKAIIAGALVITLMVHHSFSVYALENIYVIDEFDVYEPLFVHTPVISPVVIRDEDGNDIPGGGRNATQLVGENPEAWYQLRLDEDYIMHWDSMVHREILGYGDSGDSPSKYDKYTQDKWMKFPFEVLYDGEFYELQDDNYTEWIQIRRPENWTDTEDNHWIDTPIYIPSYAREMGGVGNEQQIFRSRHRAGAATLGGDRLGGDRTKLRIK